MKLRSSSARTSSSDRRPAAALALLGLRLVDQLDALLFEQDQELIDLLGIGVVVGQMVVDLTVGQVALFLARFEQGLQAVVRSSPSNPPRLMTEPAHTGEARTVGAE